MDLKVIEYVSILDERGFFKKMFSQKNLENLVGNKTIKQVNLKIRSTKSQNHNVYAVGTTTPRALEN